MQENNIRISLIQDIRGGFRVECSAEGSCIEDTRKFLFEALLSTLAKAEEMGLKLVPVDEPEKPPAKRLTKGDRDYRIIFRVPTVETHTIIEEK